jgi:transposase
MLKNQAFPPRTAPAILEVSQNPNQRRESLKNQYVPREYDVFIGLDVDSKSYSLTIEDHYTMKKQKTMPADAEQLVRDIRRQCADKRVLCAYEVGPTGWGLHDYCRKQNQECLVVAAPGIPKAANALVKTNRLDSERLCEQLKAGAVRGVSVPEEAVRGLRHMVSMRERIARRQRACKQQIKAVLLFEGLQRHIPVEQQRWSNQHLRSVRAVSCSAAVRIRLELLLEDLEHLRKQMATVLRQMRDYLEGQEELNRNREYVQSIPGVGFVTATTYLARIGDHRFAHNSREIAGFVGVVPREHSTGEQVRKGAITRLGNRVLRSLLVEAAWVAIRKDAQLKQFYERVRSRHHPQTGWRKAIVAVAHKLTQRMYCVLKQQRMYQRHA